MIQTVSIAGASKEGLLSSDALTTQARSQSRETFAAAYAFPALYVVDISFGAPEEKEATHPTPPRLMTVLRSAPTGIRYLNQIGFLVKRPGNPFPQFVSAGRAANNDIVFAIDSVSKFHAYFTNERERWQLTDYRSTHGTFLNGVRIEPNRPAPLGDGDRVRLGEHVTVQFLEPASLYAKLKG
jgi:hypothetical protein